MLNSVNTVADALRVMNECEKRGEIIVRELLGWGRYKDASGRWVLAPNKTLAMRVQEPMPVTVLMDERLLALYGECQKDWFSNKRKEEQ